MSTVRSGRRGGRRTTAVEGHAGASYHASIVRLVACDRQG
jgi:hypothetical protein